MSYTTYEATVTDENGQEFELIFTVSDNHKPITAKMVEELMLKLFHVTGNFEFQWTEQGEYEIKRSPNSTIIYKTTLGCGESPTLRIPTSGK